MGFDRSNRLIASVNLDLQSYEDNRGLSFYEAVLTRVRGLPSVVSATWATPVPFDTTYEDRIALWVEGARTNSKTETISIPVSTVTDAFVSAMGLRLEAGRDFATTDAAGRSAVMIVSRSLATRLWPGQNAIDQHARLGGASGPEVRVIGVVGDAKFATLGPTTESHVYVPMRQRYSGRQTLVVQTRDAPMSLLPQVRTAVAAVDPALPLYGAMTLAQSVENGLNPSMVAAVVAGLFAGLALLIAAVGLYAVVANSVTERTREIGVRLALGSTRRGVLRLVLQGSLRLGAWGLGSGLLASVAVARVLGGLLYGVSTTDPLTFAVVPIALALVVLIATYLPARRAVGLNPITALRNE
jgi:putative ABC transport system permease protein